VKRTIETAERHSIGGSIDDRRMAPSDEPVSADQGGLIWAPRVTPPAYRVLARKYRPSSFEDLIRPGRRGPHRLQRVETRTDSQAWILTSVRGWENHDARILARA